MAEYVTTEKVPNWALSYLEYGDPTGLSEEEIEEIDEWLGENFPDGFIMQFHDGDNAEIYFTTVPLFGLPGEVYDMDFYNP